ncbi:hypothetical protein Hanom_Chr02g00100751 [Helianthus anomalus]
MINGKKSKGSVCWHKCSLGFEKACKQRLTVFANGVIGWLMVCWFKNGILMSYGIPEVVQDKDYDTKDRSQAIKSEDKG